MKGCVASVMPDIISGQVPTHYIGKDAFQEVDTIGITRPCVKHNFLVKDIRDLASTIKKAFYLAKSGRPGPVLVDIPKEIVTIMQGIIVLAVVIINGAVKRIDDRRIQRRAAAELAASEQPQMAVAG